MAKKRTKASTPESTGGAGTIFEQHVDASFLALLLIGGIPPVLADCVVDEVHFQTGHLGWNTDDLLVVGITTSEDKRQLLCQVKSSFVVSSKDDDCRKAFLDFWMDLKSANFNRNRDCFVLVIQRGTDTLLGNLNLVLDCARNANDINNFNNRMSEEGYLNQHARRYAKEIRKIVEDQYGSISDDEFWQYLRTIHVLSLDLNTSTRQAEASIKTQLALSTNEQDKQAAAERTWTELLRIVGASMPKAGSYKRSDLPEALRNSYSRIVSSDVLPQYPYISSDLIDHKIEEEVKMIRKSRFFAEFDTVQNSLFLARQLVEAELRGGNDAVRSNALAWCARFLARSPEQEKAEEYLGVAKALADNEEVHIAEAFILSQKGHKIAALNAVAKLDSARSRSAAFMIVAHHEGAQAALEWLETARIQPENLDSDGKYFLLVQQLQNAQWDAAGKSLEAITKEDLEETPLLSHLTAITHLTRTVPIELRSQVIGQLPFQAFIFPLASDGSAMAIRRQAHDLFAQSADASRQLNCPSQAMLDEQYEIWLELKDPEKFEATRKRLESMLRNDKSPLRFVPLALQFGINVDITAIEKEIERQLALHGEMTEDAALARLALAFTGRPPGEIASYIARNQDDLSKYIDKKFLLEIQIEMLARAGNPERANQILQTLLVDNIPDPEVGRLRRIISEAEGSEPIETLKTQFQQTKSLIDLLALVEELAAKEEWDALCEFGEELFARTHSIRDAERLANAMNNARRNASLLSFLEAQMDLVAQSKHLQMLHCWSLYNEGRVLESRSELAKLKVDPDSPNVRALTVNLPIALGDWHSLSVYVAKEYEQRSSRGSMDLLKAAQIALTLGLPQSKDLLFSAVAKANEDPGVFASAYFLAAKAGWEEDENVTGWLHQAAQLSGPDGPLKKMTLKDVLNMKPDWDRHESEVLKLFAAGEIPMIAAASSLNKTLINLMVFPALRNLTENDARRRSGIPSYSGKHQPLSVATIRKIGLDATALLTLSILGLLEKALDAFEIVYLPHSTLSWLFEEKQHATFHQPSRIKDAHTIRDFLASGVLEKFCPLTPADNDLSMQIGDELATMITEAEQASDGSQRVVIRPFPVYQVGSLMEQQVDLTQHVGVLSSCTAIVDKLREKGQITAEEEKNARLYLRLQEIPWPNQPEIRDGAILYLDDLAITHFLHLGILQKLHDAGFRLIASRRELFESDQLVSSENISNQVNELIERIRSVVNSRIESGKIKLASRPVVDNPDSSLAEHPTLAAIALAEKCDAVIADDRFLNQHSQIKHDSGLTPLLCTLELINVLASTGLINSDEWYECRTRLRQIGYFFIPLTEDELFHHLNTCKVKDKNVIETAELKAIRENLLRVRMSDWLQHPKEALWLDTILQVFLRVLRRLWLTTDEPSHIRARSNWILMQMDVRGWAHSFEKENAESISKNVLGSHSLALLTPRPEMSDEMKQEYWQWAESKVLEPLIQQSPDLLDWIVDWHRNHISKVSKMDLTKSGIKDSAYVRSSLALGALNLAPPAIRKRLVEQLDFRREYGFQSDAVLVFNGSMTIQSSIFFAAIRKVLSGESEVYISATDGSQWKVAQQTEKQQPLPFVISQGDKRMVLPDFGCLSPAVSTRMASWDHTANEFNVPLSTKNVWSEVLNHRPLKDEEIEDFQNDFRLTPVYIARQIKAEIGRKNIKVETLVPSSRKYYERLVGAFDGSKSVAEYAVGAGREVFEKLSLWQPYDGFLQALFLSTHSALTTQIPVERLGSEELVRAFDFLVTNGDPVSQLGAIEIGLRILPQKPEIEPYLIRLVEHIRDEDVDGAESEFKLFSSIFRLVDAVLSRARVLANEVPFYRRLAALAQAAMIHQCVAKSAVVIDEFCKWAIDNSNLQFFIQTFADMRLEPRWNPNLVLASQLQAEFLGRILNAAVLHENNIKNSKLYDMILDDNSGTIRSNSASLKLYLPGPLEGTLHSVTKLPLDLTQAIERQLNNENVGAMSFAALVNSAPIWGALSNHAELAANALKVSHYKLAKIGDKSKLMAVLDGLATVAAVTRSQALADELRIVVRRYRHDPKYALSIQEDLHLCLVAAASREALNEWIKFVCEWFAELAFGELSGRDAYVLQSYLNCLNSVVPEFRIYSGKVDAALRAYLAIHPK